MKSSREFNRYYRKYGICIEYHGINWHNGCYSGHWVITYIVSNEWKYISDTEMEIVYSMNEAVEVAEQLIKSGRVREYK